MDSSIKRVLRVFLTLGILVAIALVIGMVFAFGGNNPILIHIGNAIDLILVAITVLFLVAVAYKLYMMVTGSRDPIVASQKRKNVANKKSSNDEMPELTELIENLDRSE